MKKIFKYLAFATICAAALSACVSEGLDTDQYTEGVGVSGIAPNPVMRGGELRILGSNLDQATEVQFAGDVSVTDIEVVTPGAHSEIRVTVPLEGPEIGRVTVVDKDGNKHSSFSELEFTEPIEVDSFTPATVLSGDVLTLKGEYLNVVRQIIFAGEEVNVTAFESQSRHELKVKVPFNAISGHVILSDVNEIEDQATIPNHIYTQKELVVGNPTIDAWTATQVFKRGDVITVTGAHLDMIAGIDLVQASDVEFTVAADAKSLSFNLPPSASDGDLVLTSYAGEKFTVGAIETVSVAELAVVSKASDGRFKAGSEVEITGTDLDLVSRVDFENAEASWYLSDGKIIATVPAAAKDGSVVVSLESGKKAYSDAIEVVKPVATAVDAAECVAGQSVITVTGTDLDLVTGVKIGTKENSFIDCQFEFKSEEDAPVAVAVSIPAQAYTGPLTLTADSGYETVTDVIAVTYDEVVSIAFDKDSYELGQNITVSGKNLMNVEQVFIKGKKVTSFALRADDAMAFGIPDGLSPGVYRLELVLIDGTQLTWPVPFTITAPFTETFIWEGSQFVNGWAGVTFGEDRFIWQTLGAKVGDVVKIYYTAPEEGWWDIQLVNGCWTSLSLDELGGGNEIKQDAGFPGGAQSFSFNITESVLATLTEDKGWGGAFVVNGDGNVEITGISLIQFGAVEKRDAIWEGSVAVDWGGNTPGAEGAMTALSWGGYDWSTVAEGTILALTFDRTAEEVQIRVSNGNWAALPGTEDPYKPEGTELKVELTAAMLGALMNEGGLVVTGQGFTLREVALVTAGPSVPAGTTIWEGSQLIDWTGNSGEDNKALGALSWGGYDWSTVEAGTTLVIEYTPVEGVETQIRVSNGNWAALPGTEDPYKPEASPLEVELSADMLAALVGEGGLVVTGQGATLTAIILK